MRWRPAVGVLVLGGIAVGLSIQGAAAERGRAKSRDKGVPSAAVPVAPRPAVDHTPGRFSPTDSSQVSKLKGSDLPAAVVGPQDEVAGSLPNVTWQPVGPEDLENAGPQAPLPGVIGETQPLQNVGGSGTIAGDEGACCISSPACVCLSNQTSTACMMQGGMHQGAGSVCANDICGCLVRACCDPVGMCVGDQSRSMCEGAGNTWHIEASCSGANSLPLPKCNAYNVNNCSWDNGLPLDDAGASRAHTHTAGVGQLPRYDFSTADDFILRGPDSSPCNITLVTAWHRQRPGGTGGNATPNGLPDWEGANVTVYGNYINPNSGLDGPGGHGLVPSSGDDLNPKVADTDGGIVYTRHFPRLSGDITMTLEGGFCDPPPLDGFETEHVYRVEIMVDPPIQLNKNRKFWLDVQGVFPFNDGLRETIQTWWMNSQNNTGFRAQTYRTSNTDYCAGGDCIAGGPLWLPTNTDLVPPASPPQRGNGWTGNANGQVRRCTGAVNNGGCCFPIGVAPNIRSNECDNDPPCNVGEADCTGVCNIAGFPQDTRLDYAFNLTGTKAMGVKPNDLCAGKVEVFDGVTVFSNAGAGTEAAAASCGQVNDDLYFNYTATCSGLLTISTCGSEFDSILAVYDNDACALATQQGCNSSACGDDGSVQFAALETGTYTIRVGSSVAGAEGKGYLTIVCSPACGLDDGNVMVNNCCTDRTLEDDMMTPHPIGCEDLDCCEAVCDTGPALLVCCTDVLTGWDAICFDAADETPECGCPCAFTCPMGAIDEAAGMVAETCGGNTNGGCNNVPPGPASYTDLGTLSCGTTINACGTVQAAANVRDTDWWSFSVTDAAPADGEVQVTLTLTGEAPVGALIVQRVLDPQCDDDGDMMEDAFLVYDEVGSASCAPRTLTTCLEAPGDYVVFVSTFDVVNDDELGDGIFNNYPCGGQDSYSFSLSCTGACTPGACCTCVGGCTDGLTEAECFAALGTFAGESTTCGALPPDVNCMNSAHGCGVATAIMCDTPVMATPSEDRLPNEPGFPCGNAGNDPNDAVWYEFTVPAGLGSVRVTTCASMNPGRDSLLGVYNGGAAGANCCNTLTPLTVVGCGDDECGFTEFLSETCIIFADQDPPVMEGDILYIQLSNWAEPVNGTYELEVQCPCAGSCCDPFNPAGPPNNCTDGTAAEACTAPLQFNAQLTCAELEPPCGRGACCSPSGGCTETVLSGCDVDGPDNIANNSDDSNHFPGTFCSSIVCNPNNQCDFNTGTEDSTHAPFGFNSTYFTDNQIYLERADNFELKGNPDNPCEIATLEWDTFTTGHDTDNDCLQGGAGSACSDEASDYLGIIITISNDEAGDEKGPTCKPDCGISACIPGADGDYHVGPGCKQSIVLGPAHNPDDPPPVAGHYWEYEFVNIGQGQNHITAHFQPPLQIEKNKKNWLAITHMWRETGGYSVIWFNSINFDGNFTQGYSSAGTQEFEPSTGTPNDMHFEFNGQKACPGPQGCSLCKLYGDVVPIECTVDLDDILYILDAFADPIANPNGDISPCRDLVDPLYACTSNDYCAQFGLLCIGGFCNNTDLDDILADLDAFAGFPACDDPCPPGACVVGPGDCRDAFSPPHGMSECECFTLGGTYCGDYTFCDPDGTCP
jgi:hypothetical protein